MAWVNVFFRGKFSEIHDRICEILRHYYICQLSHDHGVTVFYLVSEVSHNDIKCLFISISFTQIMPLMS